jgi:hypothetical protein
VVCVHGHRARSGEWLGIRLRRRCRGENRALAGRLGAFPQLNGRFGEVGMTAPGSIPGVDRIGQQSAMNRNWDVWCRCSWYIAQKMTIKTKAVAYLRTSSATNVGARQMRYSFSYDQNFALVNANRSEPYPLQKCKQTPLWLSALALRLRKPIPNCRVAEIARRLRKRINDPRST